MKSILLHIDRDEGQEARFQAAVDVARYFEGHLTCLQVAPLDLFASADPYGVSYLVSETVEKIRQIAGDEQAKIENRLRGESLHWDWHYHPGDAARLLGHHSWLADLVVVSAPGEDWKLRFPAAPTAADVVVRSRAPVLVVPDECRAFDCTAPLAIAWNGSAESCAAIRAGLPLLRQSRAVYLLTVAEEHEHDFPLTEASAYLARHGVSSELRELTRGSAPVSETLLEGARECAAGALVMGAYGHSRLRESVLGGVTRGMLQKATLPLLLAH